MNISVHVLISMISVRIKTYRKAGEGLAKYKYIVVYL